jgi:ABC-type Na+ efflux pump permease subunit
MIKGHSQSWAITWKRTKRYLRRHREVIMIVLTILMSLAFLGFGFVFAVQLESAHPQWFGNGY